MTEPSRGAPLPRHVRLWMRLSRRDLRDLPPPECAVRVDPGLAVPAADGVPLLTDHYIPQVDSPRPTVLVRTPYGRGFPWDHLFGGLIAEQGFHVVIQSCRGTGGSGGADEPFRHERADGRATVAWLREQSWFTGQLATIGPSYLGYVQFALAAEQPPELQAMVAQVAMSGPYEFAYPGGAFALENVLVATAAKLGFEHGMAAVIRTGLRVQRRMRRVSRELPLIRAYPPALGGRVAWFEDWLTHPDQADPYWAALQIPASALAPALPVSLLTGWWDACLDPVLAEYRRLRDGGRRPVRLVIGPWTHSSAFNKALPVVLGEALSWLRAYTGDGQIPESQIPESQTRSATRTSRCGCTSTAPANGGTWPTGRRRKWPASPGIWPPGAAWFPSRPPSRGSPRSAMTRRIPPRQWAASCSPARPGPRTTGPWRPAPTSWSSPVPR